MCGIVGIYGLTRNVTQDQGYIASCMATMRHRGPDANGTWDNGHNYITGFVRLAIRDLSAKGNQPMLSACGNYCITFNGEIYNAENFRQALQQKGVQFISSSDTELLLYGLIHFGVDYVLDRFDGMFAFAFYNHHSNELVLARDRTGIKPLYIGYDRDEAIIFSSQYDHIINYRSLQQQPLDAQAIGTYLQLGYVPAMMGAVQQTFLFPHGHYALVNQKGLQLKQYYRCTTRQAFDPPPADDAVFTASVSSQLVSDVPVGSYLSGGVDSALVTLWANSVKPIQSFTIGTGDAFSDETEEVLRFAGMHQLQHAVKKIGEQDFLALIPDYFQSHTEPFADFSSLPSLLLSAWVKKTHTVILSGDGPDELFWGYDRNTRYMDAAKKFFRSKPLLAGELLLHKLTHTHTAINRAMLRQRDFTTYYYGSQWLYGSKIVQDIFRAVPGEPAMVQQIRDAAEANDARNWYPYIIRDMEMNINLQRILLKVDRSGMYNSVEVRVPYLSNTMLDLAFRQPVKAHVQNGQGKYFLKQQLARYTGATYPFKKKKGFLVPMKDWLRGSIQQDVYDQCLDMPAELRTFFRTDRLKYYLDRHCTQQEDLSGIIWAIYALVNWYRVHRNSIHA